MAKLTLNPIFMACHGRMDGLVFVRRHGKHHIRIYAKHSNPDTPAVPHETAPATSSSRVFCAAMRISMISQMIVDQSGDI